MSTCGDFGYDVLCMLVEKSFLRVVNGGYGG